MKNRLYALLVLCAIMVLTQKVSAQCGTAGRYLDTLFTSYTLDSVTFSDTFALKMDIYQPVGDNSPLRPLVILAHGGSFIGGTREDDNTITQLCADLASKGYVTASIDYRIATDLVSFYADTVYDITVVMQSISDMKAAVRYFYKDVYTNGNSYRIDTSRIFIGGNSAGAVIGVQYAFLDTISKAPAYIQTIINQNGGLAGNSGNPGYSNTVRGIVNLAGGLNNPEWITPCSLPVVSAQGTADPVVPYTCGYPELYPGLYVDVRLCGLGSMQQYITENTYFWSSILFPGQGHVPWQSNATYFYQVDTIVTSFLNKAQCTSTPTSCPGLTGAGITRIASNAQITLFPNPANDFINVESSEQITGISLYDATGRLVAQTSNINVMTYQINTASISKGVYIVKISNRDEVAAIIRKMVIE